MTSIAVAIPAAVQAEAFRTETITGVEAFLALEPEWTALTAAAGLDHPFLTHEWMRTWWQHFGAGRDLHIVVARDRAGALVAIAPLMSSHTQMLGLPIRRLEAMANEHSPRFDFIIKRGTEAVFPALWDHLLRATEGWEVLQLTQLPAGSRVTLELPSLARQSGFQTGRWASEESPYVPLIGAWEPYFQGLASKHRSNLRNRFKRLGALGPVAFETVRSSDALADGLRLEAAAWKGAAHTAIESRADVRQFYQGLAEQAAAQGWLRLQFLSVAGRRIAFQYVIRYRGKQFLLKPGYDPEFSVYSPSNLLCARAMEDAFESGVTEHDFLGAAEPWKREWASCIRPHEWLFVFPNTARGRLLYRMKFHVLPRLQSRPVYRSLRAMAVIAGIRA
jgi:CelD/BcsL family acetyltransferase involved in cellulose biosynthesis